MILLGPKYPQQAAQIIAFISARYVFLSWLNADGPVVTLDVARTENLNTDYAAHVTGLCASFKGVPSRVAARRRLHLPALPRLTQFLRLALPELHGHPGTGPPLVLHRLHQQAQKVGHHLVASIGRYHQVVFGGPERIK